MMLESLMCENERFLCLNSSAGGAVRQRERGGGAVSVFDTLCEKYNCYLWGATCTFRSRLPPDHSKQLHRLAELLRQQKPDWRKSNVRWVPAEGRSAK